jgi:hypothetical protein
VRARAHTFCEVKVLVKGSQTFVTENNCVTVR